MKETLYAVVIDGFDRQEIWTDGTNFDYGYGKDGFRYFSPEDRDVLEEAIRSGDRFCVTSQGEAELVNKTVAAAGETT